ncbi:MAG: hypothetical protein ABF662_05790 [Liquorilactobacillus satsumensis]|uniref:Phage protein n=2 Tax=Lactobacillales TaxID=186826 RepID=A0A0R1V2N1_9LACO|nr:hypothetical protein [Liquorilactobacillus satsumensis]KRL98042.1 hypothetical protein FD50_GL001001 [Liquorilactobacillus satsumensis DSM 16230 = JCM 12392]
MKYQKKPVVIEAVQYDGTPESQLKIAIFMRSVSTDELRKNEREKDGELVIHTLEGDMKASIGDFIIKGVHGEFYPCKPDIFEETYDKI